MHRSFAEPHDPFVQDSQDTTGPRTKSSELHGAAKANCTKLFFV